MSLQELPGSFGVMFPAFSLPMKAERSRNKERLEASLAGLCELELLKQRQECRVLSALCLGDSPVPGRPPWGSLRSARCALDAPKGNASEDFNRRLQARIVETPRFPRVWTNYDFIGIKDEVIVCQCSTFGQDYIQTSKINRKRVAHFLNQLNVLSR
ncbi:Dapper-like protein 3 [Larimichthys crocea]|uniref:Uncharacterized protein n=1 Tax=Larimichthys crocea TaxID=215358 RepID=A0ACD3R576_LARCR|nr:Dapper-like protein 3 [Larimichthys crocea]